MVSTINTAVIIIDATGTIEIANARMAHLVGRSVSAIEGRSVTEFFHGAGSESVVEKIGGALTAASAPWTERLLARHADGEELRLRAEFSVIQPSADNISVLAMLAPDQSGNDGKAVPLQSSAADVRNIVTKKAGHFTAGHLEMIGLEEVRASLGDRWEKLASRVYQIADSILKSRLAKQDVFRRDADGNYIICFAQLCDEQAWFKAKALGQEIREALLGEETDDTFAEFKLDAETRERISGVKAETYNVAIPEGDIDDIPDMMDAIKQKVETASAQMRKLAGSMLKSLVENCGTRFRGLKGTSGSAPPLRIVEFDRSSLMKADQLRNIFNGAPKISAQLDSLLLGAAVERLYNADPTQMPLTIVEVYFSTLMDRASSRSYFDVCAGAVGKVAESMIIKVRDIPTDLHHGRTSEILRLLRNHSRLTTIQLKKPDLGNIDIPESRIALVVMDYQDLAFWLKRDPKTTIRFAARLRNYKVRLFVDNITKNADPKVLNTVRADYFAMHPLASVS
jgi:PAS domain S-box-containing protein